MANYIYIKENRRSPKGTRKPKVVLDLGVGGVATSMRALRLATKIGGAQAETRYGVRLTKPELLRFLSDFSPWAVDAAKALSERKAYYLVFEEMTMDG